MANINISVDAFVCETPIINSVTYTGTRYEFVFSWSSKGDYYSTFDNTTLMHFYVDLYHEGDTTPYHSGQASQPVPFNTNDYTINVLDYNSLFSGKDRVVFTLQLVNTGCNNSTSYEIPSNTIT